MATTFEAGTANGYGIVSATPIWGSVYEAGIACAYGIAKGVLTQGSLLGGDSNPELDITFNCNGYDSNGDPNQGVAYAYALAYGSKPFVDFDATAAAYGIATATPIWGSVYEATAYAYALAYGDLLLEGSKHNWVKWSNIGSLDFTIGRDNVAGERPLDWKGWIYGVKKLGSKVVVYGENGVSILTPSGNNYGLNTIYRIGLKSKHAVTGDDSVHFFIDNKGQLYSLSEGLQKLDYSEYLSAMSSPVMSYDVENELIYICDGIYGYVYSPRDQSLGSGPVNIAGISSQGGTLYAVSPATISIPTFQMCSDIYDFGTRKNKNIYSIEVGTDLTETLEAAIDYRIDKAASFVTTDWHTVDSRGMAFIPVMAQEVRARVRSTVYNWFTVDYIIFNGEVLNY